MLNSGSVFLLKASAARHDWGWAPKFDLAKMSRDMLAHLREPVAA